MELIPYTIGLSRLFETPCIILILPSVSGWGNRRSGKSKFFWESEVHDIAEQLELLEDNVKSRKLGAKRVLSDFKKARKELVEARFAVCRDVLPLQA